MFSKYSKRFLCFSLVAVMGTTVVPSYSVFADGNENTTTEAVSTSVKETEARTVENVFTVTFQTEAGKDKEEYKTGEKIKKPEDPKKDGYEFDGWYYKKDDTSDKTEKWDFEKDKMPANDLKLNAEWKKKASETATEATTAVKKEVAQSYSNQEEKTTTEKSVSTEAATTAKTTTATTAANKKSNRSSQNYSVYFDYADGSGRKDSMIVRGGDYISAPETPVRSGYEFVAWYHQSYQWDFKLYTMPENDITLTAYWKKTGQETTTEQTATTEQKTEEEVATEQELTLKQQSVAVAVNKSTQLKVEGVDESEVSWSVDDESIASIDSTGTVFANDVGAVYITATVGTRNVRGLVIVTNPTLAKKKAIIARGKATSVAIKGFSGASKSKVSVSSKRASAYVSSSGRLVITPKKKGTTKVKVTTDGKKSTYTATVTTRQALKAISRARKAKGCRYSQGKRMRKGYYDCSSLIWRIYKPSGINFGSNSYAPVAAREAKYMKRHGRKISMKRLKASKLLPGDVIFYSYTRNGRYRNISHVALYIGNGKIIHAANSRVGVIEAKYTAKKAIRMIVRPSK